MTWLCCGNTEPADLAFGSAVYVEKAWERGKPYRSRPIFSQVESAIKALRSANFKTSTTGKFCDDPACESCGCKGKMLYMHGPCDRCDFDAACNKSALLKEAQACAAFAKRGLHEAAAMMRRNALPLEYVFPADTLTIGVAQGATIETVDGVAWTVHS